jgi:hypothetical protein
MATKLYHAREINALLKRQRGGRRWGHCVKEAGWGLKSRIHVVADGAEWIQQQSQEVFGQQGSFLVDFYDPRAASSSRSSNLTR